LLSSLFQHLVPRRSRRLADCNFKPRVDWLEDRRMLATFFVDDAAGFENPAHRRYDTIQEAVNAASAGDKIKVAPGKYEEAVTVDKTLTILGAQSEKDFSKSGPVNPSKSSTVEIPLDGNFGFNLQANDIVIRGFTIQDSDDNGAGSFGSATGIYINGNNSGHTIANNVLQGNTMGIYLNTNGDHTTTIEKNLFRDNNQGPGVEAASGNGIYSDAGASDVDIVRNKFTLQDNASIIFVGSTLVDQSDIKINRNQIIDDAPIILINMTDSEISQNVSKNSAGSGIFLGGGVVNTTIEKNVITSAEFTGINLRTNAFGTSPEPNHDLEISKNEITHNGGAGIRLSDGAHDILVEKNDVNFNGTSGDAATGLDGIILELGAGTTAQGALNNEISKNHLFSNARDGIRVDALSTGNLFDKNEARRNVEHDYHDDSTGTGTAGTANTWTKNKGRTQNRPGLIG
jgi:nitrous oxidase accessory protein NosD